VALTQAITDGHQPPRTVSKRFEFAELGPDGTARAAGLAPYLDYEPPVPEESGAIAAAIEQPWLASGFEEVATGWAIEHTLAEHLHEVEQRVAPAVARTRTQVRQRLTAEINYWDTRHAELLDRAAAGRELRISPATAERRALEMERRLERREHDLESDAQLTPLPPTVDGGALVIPQGLVDRFLGRRSEPVAAYARETREVERRAVDAVLAAERVLGRVPTEMPHNNPGFDVRSEARDRRVIRIEVKGRIVGSDEFAITRNEVPQRPSATR